jgi:hypothetical protein
MLRARESIIEIACSAVVNVFPPGAFITTIPRLLASFTSTLSIPMPARATTLRFRAFSKIGAVTLVPLRIPSPSNSPIRSARTLGSFVALSLSTTTWICPVASRISFALGDMLSLSITLYIVTFSLSSIVEHPSLDAFRT